MASQRASLQIEGFDYAQHLKLFHKGKISNVDFATSGICNLKCIYCALDSGKSDTGELTRKQLEEALIQCSELGAITTSVTGKGEPLMDPKYLPITEHLNELGLAQMLFTNGTLITKRKAEILNRNNVSPIIKINCLEPDVHDGLVGVEGAFDKAWKGLQNVLDVFDRSEKENTTRIGVQTLITKKTLRHIPELLEFCSNEKLYPVVDLIIPSGKMVQLQNYEELQVTPEENKWLYKKFREIMGYYGSGVQGGGDGCPLAMGICINNIGDVVCNNSGISCLTNNIILGNVKTESISVIFRKLTELRKKVNFVPCSNSALGSGYFLPCGERVRVEQEYFKQGKGKATPYYIISRHNVCKNTYDHTSTRIMDNINIGGKNAGMDSNSICDCSDCRCLSNISKSRGK